MAAKVVETSQSVKKAFVGGDQGFIDLKLASIEETSHNTKKFRFELPESDQVSGLPIACRTLPPLVDNLAYVLNSCTPHQAQACRC